MRIIFLFIFFIFFSVPAHAENLVLSASDISDLEAKAAQGRADAQSILDQYKAQQAAKEKMVKAAAENDGVIGTVMEIEGTATIGPEGQEPAAVAVNTPVHLSDIVETGAGAKLFVLFIDNTEMTLAENTKLAVNEWNFDPDDSAGNKGVYSILQGTFSYVSGLIAKKENPDVHINTPVGSIGIRGTEFWGGRTDDDYGVLVKEGSVSVKTDAGQVVVDKGQGTTVHDRKSQPTAAKVWAAEKISKAVATVALKKPDEVRQRIVEQQEQQKVLVEHYKEFMQTRRVQQREQRQQQMQQRPQRQGQAPRQQNQQQRQNTSPAAAAPSPKKAPPAPPRSSGGQTQEEKNIEKMKQLQQMQKQQQLNQMNQNQLQMQMQLNHLY